MSDIEPPVNLSDYRAAWYEEYTDPEGWDLKGIADTMHANVIPLPHMGIEEYQLDIDFKLRRGQRVWDGMRVLHACLDVYPKERWVNYQTDAGSMHLQYVTTLVPFERGIKVVSSNNRFVENTLIVKSDGGLSVASVPLVRMSIPTPRSK